MNFEQRQDNVNTNVDFKESNYPSTPADQQRWMNRFLRPEMSCDSSAIVPAMPKPKFNQTNRNQFAFLFYPRRSFYPTQKQRAQ